LYARPIQKGAMNFLKSKWLLPTEKLVLLMCALSAILFYAFNLPSKRPFHFYIVWLRPLPYAYILALFVCLLVLFFQDGLAARRKGVKASESETWRRFVKAYLQPSSIFRDLRYINAANILFIAFLHLKHVIPHVNTKIYDQFFWNLEKDIFFGKSATEWMQQIFGASSAQFWSHGYEGFYGYFCIILFIFVMQRNKILAEEFCSAFMSIWLIGILMVYALPTVGPCYYAPEVIKNLPETPVSIMQAQLWRWKLMLDADPKNADALFSISGLPSLHFGVAVLGSIYLNKINKFLAFLSWVFVAITFGATIFFGWHYVSDNLAALILVWISIRSARMLLKESGAS